MTEGLGDTLSARVFDEMSIREDLHQTQRLLFLIPSA